MPRIARKFSRLFGSAEADISTSLQLWHLTMDALLPPSLPPASEIPTTKKPYKKRRPIPMSFVLVSKDMVYLNRKPKKDKKPKVPKVPPQKRTKKNVILASTIVESFREKSTVILAETNLVPVTTVLTSTEQPEEGSKKLLRRRRKQDNPRRSADQFDVGVEEDLKEEEPLTSKQELADLLSMPVTPCNKGSYEDCSKSRREDGSMSLQNENVVQTVAKDFTACGDHWVLNEQDMADLQMFSASSQIPLDQFLVHFTKEALHEAEETTKLIREKEKACEILFPTGEHAYTAESTKKSHPNDPFYFSFFEV